MIKKTNTLTARKHEMAFKALQKQLGMETSRRKMLAIQLERKETHYRHLLARSQSMQKQSRFLAHQVLIAQEEEKKEISRELHDEVAQILAGINVHLASLKEASEINGKSLRFRIAQTQRLVEHSVRVVHRFALKLRPAMLDDLGLIPALRSFVRELPSSKGLRIRFTAFEGADDLDNANRTVLFRVAQEALTNVASHAQATLATVHIDKTETGVSLEVHDNGKSFQLHRIQASCTKNHLGLIGMQERVEMIHGIFSIDSARGKGTTVRAEIPCRSGVKRSRS